MQENSYWTNLPQAEIAERLKEMGTPVSQPTAGALLDDLGFTKRQSWPMNGVSTFASLTIQLTVRSTTVHVIKKLYQTQRKTTEAFRQDLPIKFDPILPRWNYTAIAGAGI